MAGSQIPMVQAGDRNLNQVQENFSQALQPIMSNPQNFGAILKNQSLSIGSNTINHGLGRTLQGWSIVRLRAASVIYDTQDDNPNPQKTLMLNASAAVTVDIYVF